MLPLRFGGCDINSGRVDLWVEHGMPGQNHSGDEKNLTSIYVSLRPGERADAKLILGYTIIRWIAGSDCFLE